MNRTTAPALRDPREGPALRDPREVIREEMALQLPVLRALDEGPLTVPALAGRLGRPVEEVVYWVMGMRRYGLLAETGDADDDGYFAYAATDRGRRRGGLT
jgi:hypothetical protein